MAARQDDDDRIIMLNSPERESENHASSEGNRDQLLSSIALQVCSRQLSSVRKTVEERELLHDLLVLWCILASLLDPLFCYVLIVDQAKNCISFDETLRRVALVLRSVMDFGYILLIVFQFRKAHSDSISDSASADEKENNGGFGSIARKYLLSSFTADILALLPFPQVMVFIVFPAIKGSHFAEAVRILIIGLFIQLLPREFRLYSFLKGGVKWKSDIVSNSARAKAMFSLILYMLASHVFGAFWYLFSIERKATCLQIRCHSHPYCPLNDNKSSIQKCIDTCSGKASSSDIAAFNFGIFGDAFNSDIVYSTDFGWKWFYCFYWGLQNLSSLGQGLKTSGNTKEIFFAVVVTVSGLVLFALLIGNFQTIMQAKIVRQEEMRLKEEEEKEKEKEKKEDERKKEKIELMLNLIFERLQQSGLWAEN